MIKYWHNFLFSSQTDTYSTEDFQKVKQWIEEEQRNRRGVHYSWQEEPNLPPGWKVSRSLFFLPHLSPFLDPKRSVLTSVADPGSFTTPGRRSPTCLQAGRSVWGLFLPHLSPFLDPKKSVLTSVADPESFTILGRRSPTFLRAGRSVRGPFFLPHLSPFLDPKSRALTSVADPRCLSQGPRSEFCRPGSRVKKNSGSGSASKNLSILTQKLFLSSRKNDSGCSSRIPDPDPYVLPIPDPG